jgi:hypothetical protein
MFQQQLAKAKTKAWWVVLFNWWIKLKCRGLSYSIKRLNGEFLSASKFDNGNS